MAHFRYTPAQYLKERINDPRRTPPNITPGEWILIRTQGRCNFKKGVGFGRFKGYLFRPNHPDAIHLSPSYTFKPLRENELLEFPIMDRGNRMYVLSNGFELWTTKKDIVGILEEQGGYGAHANHLRSLDINVSFEAPV